MEDLTGGVQRLQSLLAISRELNSYLKLDELLYLVLDRAMQVVHVEAGTLWLVEEDGCLVPVAARGPRAEALFGLCLRPGEGLAGQVVQRDEPQLVADVAREPAWAGRFDHATGYTTRSMLCVPLRGRKRVIGCLQLINKRSGGRLSEDDLELALAFAGHAAVALENSQLYFRLHTLFHSLIRALVSALDARDPYTSGHSERVARYAVLTGRKLGLDAESLENLEWAALLHDVGKIGIRDYILLQEGPLDREKWEIMKSHPEIGARILENVTPRSLVRGIIEGALCHQEKYDGSGYPQGLKGEEIPLFGRVIAVCDTFDAITTDRPYRKGATFAAALGEIRRCSGSQLDPAVVEAFCAALGEEIAAVQPQERDDSDG